MSSLCFYKYFCRPACLSIHQFIIGTRFISTALPDSWYKRLPVVDEKDIEEKAIKGSGPGGQSVNKTHNCCQIKHIPTGIVVSCQQTRFLEKNRFLARRQLQEKLDVYYNGDQGLVAEYKREKSERKEAKRLETNKTLEKKRLFKSGQDIHNDQTSQLQCPQKEKLFRNIIAFNVHLEMHPKQRVSEISYKIDFYSVHRYHYTFRCYCEKNINAARLHYLRARALNKGQCLKLFSLHQDFIADENICGIHCPISCSNCEKQFQNRTSLRRHHSDMNKDARNAHSVTNCLSSLSKSNKHRKRPNRRRPLPLDQIKPSRQTILPSYHQIVTIYPYTLTLLRNFNNEPTSKSLSSPIPSSLIDSILTCESNSDKATQTYTRVSIGTDCCSLTNPISDLPHSIPIKNNRSTF